MQLIPLSQLKEWDKNHNLRRIEKAGHIRLDKNLDLGQHSTLLVYIDELGNNIVVGGNHRAKLMLKKGYNEAKCIMLSFGQDDLGYYGILDGEVYKDKTGNIPVHFKTIEQGIIEYSFSHNSRGAYYIEDEVINYVHSMPDIDWSKYDADFRDPVNLEEAIAEIDKKGLDDAYSQRLGEVLYEPKQTNHKIADLFQKETKFDADIESLENNEIKEMLKARVSFFSNFDFSKIADYYAYQATAEEKAIMEKLALVLLDKDKLVKNGFSEIIDGIMSEEEFNANTD